MLTLSRMEKDQAPEAELPTSDVAPITTAENDYRVRAWLNASLAPRPRLRLARLKRIWKKREPIVRNDEGCKITSLRTDSSRGSMLADGASAKAGESGVDQTHRLQTVSAYRGRLEP